MAIDFAPQRHGDIEHVVKEARTRFDELLAVMRVGETVKDDVWRGRSGPGEHDRSD